MVKQTTKFSFMELKEIHINSIIPNKNFNADDSKSQSDTLNCTGRA